MSDFTPTTSSPAGPEVDPPTEEIFVRDTNADPAAGGRVGETPWDTGATDDDEWPDRGPRKGIRMSVPTVALLALLIAAGGIWGGAALQRSHGTTSGSSTRASALASLFGGRGGGAGGFTGAGAAALGGATAGTVTEVSGSILYVTNASGDLVKVTVGPTATVNRNAKSALGSLQVGDTVVVEGTKARDGSVAATSVSATEAGVTSGLAGRFGAGATGG